MQRADNKYCIGKQDPDPELIRLIYFFITIKCSLHINTYLTRKRYVIRVPGTHVSSQLIW